MFSSLRTTAIALLVLLATAFGRHPILTTPKKSPFAPLPMSPDSCVLEVFSIRLPHGDQQVNQTLWEEVDELHFASEARQRLMQNGFRVGLLSGQIPKSLAELMDLSAKPPIAQEEEQIALADLAANPRIVRSRMHARTGQRCEVVTSGIYEQLPLLLCENGEVGGKTYEQAQGVLALKAFPQSDGSVQIEVTPELQYGQSQKKFVPDQGVWRPDFCRPKLAFAELAINAKLAPGSMLVLTSLPNLSGSLGHYFFTEKDGRLEQKLLIIRLTQTQHDDLFSPSNTRLENETLELK
jgi:hypothetical protein